MASGKNWVVHCLLRADWNNLPSKAGTAPWRRLGLLVA